jgi:two-component system heavy metal sensor histidine kinase CusS
MSSARARRPASLGLRLALTFMGGSLAVVVVTSGIQSWTYQHEVHSLNQARLRDQVLEVSRILTQRPWDSLTLSEALVGEGPTGVPPQVWMRVSDDQGLLGETPGMEQLIPRAWFDGRGTMVKGGRTFVLVEYTDGKHRIQGAMDTSEDERILAGYLSQMLVSIAGAVVIAALVGWWAAYRGLAPVRDIAAAARRITAYPLRERLEAGHVPRELQDLVQALNAMLDRIDHAFQRLTHFSTDLAHEFRTPIAILMGEAETVLARERSAEDYRRALESSLEELGRLSRLTSRMLFLARTENPQSAVPRMPVPMEDLVRAVLAFFEAAAEEKGVALAAEVRGTLLGDPDMLRQALGNLISNALEATPPGGSVQVRGEPRGWRWILTVTDTGRGIPAGDLPRVLDRFYRSGRSGAGGTSGTGLGLAIVQSIMQLYGGQLEIQSEAGRGTTVTLDFPGSLSISADAAAMPKAPGPSGHR